METLKFNDENNILISIKNKFPSAEIENASISKKRIYFSLKPDIFFQTIEFTALELGFFHLCTITGIDNLDSFEFLYHTANENGILLTLKLKTPRNDSVIIKSVLPVYNGATFYERELEGLFGIKVEGLPEGRQYPLPDNWPAGQYPLRKDWDPSKNEDKSQKENILREDVQ